MLSSKAIRAAIKAKEIIQGRNESLISEAVASLETLLPDASFLRLDPNVQVEILLLLSHGYDRLEQFTKQERFLLKYAKKRELYRYHVLLKTALVRSYIHQDRIFEAEHLLAKLAKPTLAYSSLEEKIEIAKTIVFTEDNLKATLLSAELQAKNGLLQEALKKYKTVLSSVEKYYFPFQASTVEKIRLQYSLLIRIAELYYLLGDYHHASLILSNWPNPTAEISGIKPYFERRSFLISLFQVNKNLAPADVKVEAPSSFSKKSFSPLNNELFSPEYISWKAHEAIVNKDIPALNTAIDALAGKKREEFSLLIHILQGFREALSFNIIAAYDALEKGTATENTWTQPWRAAALNLFAKLGLQRALILALSHQEMPARTISNKVLQRIGGNALAGSFRKLLSLINSPCTKEEKPLDADSFFAKASQESCPWPFIKTPLSLFINARLAYNQALGGTISEETALYILEEASAQTPDAISQLLCYRIDLLIRSGNIEDACTLSLALLQDYPEYDLTPPSILLCLLAAEGCSKYMEECQLFEKYLYSKPLTPQAILLTFRLFESKKEFPENTPLEQKDILFSLQKRDSARKYLVEASKSKEAGYIKERIEKAHHAFQEAQVKLKALIASAQNSESSGILFGYLLSLYAEQIDFLERAILSPFAFNELPALITETASDLSREIENAQCAKKAFFLSPSFLQESTTLAATADLYAYAFTRDFDKVVTLVNTYPESVFQVSRSACRGVLFAAKGLYGSRRITDAHALLSRLDETTLKDIDYELALEVAIEKSLCLKEIKQTRKAMSLLAWVINSPCASSLRIKAMVVRADMYLAIHRNELAVKQLESVVNKGGEWGTVAERKLRELQKVHGSS